MTEKALYLVFIMLSIAFLNGCGGRPASVVVKKSTDKTFLVECVTSHVSFAVINRFSIDLIGDGPVYSGNNLSVKSDRYVIENKKGTVSLENGTINFDLLLKTDYSDSYFEAPFNGRRSVKP